MATKVELEQLLEIAISSPDVGNVNFNVLRGLLFEIIKHIGINKKAVCINEGNEDFRSVYDMVRDGALRSKDQSPNDLNEQDETVISPESNSENQQDTPQSRSESRRSKSASPRIRNEIKTPENASETSVAKLEGSYGVSPELVVTPPLSRGNTPNSLPSPVKRGLHKTSSRSSQSFHDSAGVRSDLTLIKRNLLDLQTRIEYLEGPRTPPKVKSNASMFLMGDSKTPAQDMIEVINMGRKLEAFDSTIQGLCEMINTLNTEVKDVVVRFENSEISEKVNNVSEKLENLEEQLQNQKRISENEKEIGKKLEEIEKELKELALHLNSHKRESERMIHHEINQLASQLMNREDKEDATPFVISSEPPKECYEALDKCDQLQEAQTNLENQVRGIDARVDDLESNTNTFMHADTSSDKTMVDSDVALQLKHEIQSLNKKIDLASKDTLQSMNRLNHEQKEIKSFLDEQKQQMPQLQSTVRLQEKDLQDLKSALQALFSEKEELQSQQSLHSSRTYSADASEDISLIRAMIFDLQEEKDNLKHANKTVLDEIYQKQKSLDDLNLQLERMQMLKADKDLVTNEIKFKADKRDVELKVEREDFDRYIGLVDQSLRDLLQRLERHENILREAIDSISGNIKTKLDKTEVEPLKHYFEERLKMFKPKPPEVRPPAEEYAAGFRKVLIKNFSCISCDRPVEYARDGMFPPLPLTQAMPIKKSNRPYTTYELDQVRQHMIRGGLEIDQERFEAIDGRRRRLQSELLKLNGVPNIEELAEVIDRPCGGSHTLSFPHSRSIIRRLHLNKEEILIESGSTDKSLQNVDILGQDGHIYKGLVEDGPVVLPQIKDKSPSSSPMMTKGRDGQEESMRVRSNTPSSALRDPTSADDISSS